MDINKEAMAFIYPNPAKGKVYIKFINQLKVNEINILDAQGRLIHVILVNDKISDILELSLDKMNPGMYQLFVHSD